MASWDASAIMQARNVSDMGQEDGTGHGEKTRPQVQTELIKLPNGLQTGSEGTRGIKSDALLVSGSSGWVHGGSMN